MTDGWRIAEPADGVGVFVEADGVWLRSDGPDLTDTQSLRSVEAPTRLGRLLPVLIPQLIDLGLATFEEGALRIPFEHFATLESREIDAFDACTPWSPYTIELKASGWLGGPTFSYRYGFYLGTQRIHLVRRGCFVRRGDTICRLDSQTYGLVEAIDHFNALPADARESTQAFLKFAEVKGLAEGVGVQIDRFLAHERVLVPPRLGLNLVVEDEDRISFTPKIDGIDTDEFRRAFFALDDVDEIYSVERDAGERVRVVLADEQREVLRRMQRVRHLGGAERAQVLRNPIAVFDGVAGSVEIDLESFGPRVRGVGDFPFIVQPYLRRDTGIFDGPEAVAGGPGESEITAGIQCSYVDGRVEDVALKSRQEVRDLHEAVKQAWRRGEGTIEVQGKSILLDEPFMRAVEELHEQVAPRRNAAAGPEKKKRQYLLIYTNENEIEYEEAAADVAAGQAIVPHALSPHVVLKQHQLQGLAWMQRCFQTGRRGCLLADDMGMGKTLQILTFLAWAIEQRELSAEQSDPELPPWNPILIVAPLVLLENETWINEMRTYFGGEGAIFQPCLLLRGAELRALRRPDMGGPETVLGAAVLDLERLRQYRIILTNYETVTNYQHSFARMKAAWSIVVTDEAQEYKIPSTKISHALKSLAPRFRIAATGTPVETRLLDVWNIFDFLQPGKLLGSAAEFSRTYERGDGSGPTVNALKTRLRFGTPEAFVLRREKSALADLPPKIERELRCDLSSEQRRLHIELVRQVGRSGEGRHPFEVIHQLLRLYQHPALVPRYEPISSREAIACCPKLAAVVECLRQIRTKGEKALIFTRSLDMQHLLAQVIADLFGFEADIVNGSASRMDQVGRGRRSRKAMIQRFRGTQGFSAIILSPDVAGIGLTLTEANHVIHYGRWWNPAKELQATDRAYRIGQTREVHVYYPIAVDPLREFDTFDEKLHALLCRRRDLAAEFLAPLPSEDDLQQELMTDVVSDTKPLTATTSLPIQAGLDLTRIPPHRIDALLAALEARSGAEVLLPPAAGSEGVNLIVIERERVRLVHCAWREGADVKADVISDAVSAVDGYRARRLAGLPRGIKVDAVLIVRCGLSARAQDIAASRRVETITAADLDRRLQREPCSWTEIEAMNGRRLGSMRDVQAAIDCALGPWREADRSQRGGPVRQSEPHVDEAWIDELLRCDRYLAQQRMHERAPLSEDRVRQCLRALTERGGRMTQSAFALRLGMTDSRIPGFLAMLRRLLNIDGYQILAFDKESETIELNRELLRVQFEIGRSEQAGV